MRPTRILMGLAALLAAALVAIPCWIALHRSDLPDARDADLAAVASPVADARNGYTALVAAADAVDWPEGADERLNGLRSQERSEPAWIRQLLTRNAQALDAFERVAERPDFQLAFAPSLEQEEHLEPLLAAQRLAKLAGAEARLLAADGRIDEALDRAALGLRVGARVGSGDGIDLIGLMFAVSLRAIALEDVEAVVRAVELAPEQGRALVVELEAARWRPTDWASTWATEYRSIAASLAEVDRDVDALDVGESLPWSLRWLPPDYLWQLNRTLAALADVYRERQRRSNLDCRAAATAAAGDDEGRELRMAKALVSPNPVGGLLVDITTPNLDRFDAKRCHIEARISLVQVLVGARAYVQEHGVSPPRLEALVPRYLGQVPVDGFVPGPIGYAPARGVVYSVGEDFVDVAGGDDPQPGDAAEPALAL